MKTYIYAALAAAITAEEFEIEEKSTP